MFCSKCGTKLDDTAKFCGGCGTPTGVSAAPVPPAPAVAPVPPAPVVAAPVPPAPVAAAPVPPAPVAAPVPPAPVVAAPVPPAPVAAPVPPAPAQPVYQAPSGGKAPALRYEIFGANLPAVSVKLNQGESMYTQSGGMVWMDNGINMETNMKGGLMKGLGRMISGDSLFIATYTSMMPDQEITFASSFPGSITHIELNGNSIIAQKTSFLCAQQGITLSVHLNRSLGSGLFGGEGFVLQKMTGVGHLFLEIDGSLVERVLRPGEKIKVDTGNVAAFEESVQYQAEMVKGFKNILFGGEGLFLTTLTGPGKVWLQTMTLPTFAKQLMPYLPKPSN